ncbi:hypothetical protein PK28_01355 [Hymenobacter sp. DG25B]|uniref:DUF4783 domain-containing protein n=1 Tax=Hymenobacter sp. DG25B TaxID=1385664 RepID=UPI0005409F53|nr:DUF4783 domain-containing protein [Hymenobacter sp. DG25B]AIZ62663.1 hypothetical protein PK28_01355 [Hymenobacter sp. DG25B]
MKTSFFRVVVLVGLWLLTTVGAYAQGEAFGAVKGAVRGGSSHGVAQYFGSAVELGFDGDKQSYSATQAEFVLKDFFAKNAPTSFEFIHQGSSNEGIQYAIGKYVGKSGTYRVFIKMKPAQGKLLIDTIDFTKE